MKIIFLDCDGVINSARKDVEVVHTVNGEYYLHEPDLIGNLNSLIDSIGDASIVVSSTWRLGVSLEELQILFREIGIKAPVIGKTDNYNQRFVVRGCEILKWLIDHEDMLGCHYYDFEDYIILDDDTDMLLDQSWNFIHVDSQVGLTKENCCAAALILTGDVL